MIKKCEKNKKPQIMSRKYKKARVLRPANNSKEKIFRSWYTFPENETTSQATFKKTPK
jgi:hypothetical protein